MDSLVLFRKLLLRSPVMSTHRALSSTNHTTAHNTWHTFAARRFSPSPATSVGGLSTVILHPRYSTTSGVVTLTAEPRVCLHDVHTSLAVRGLAPSAAVTLRAVVVNESGKKFCSHGQYVANDRGDVVLDSDASVGGSYTGVFPAGLLTNLTPVPGDYPFLRLYKKYPEQPFKVKVTVHAGHHATSADEPTDSLTSTDLTRLLMAPGVRRRKVRDGRVRGVLYLPPPHHSPAVGIVDMFGAVGGIMEFRAAMLASRGYAVLALPFFAYDDLPKVPDVLDLEYFEEAVNFVMAQENVIPDGCGMISVSLSSSVSLLLASKMSAVKAVVCIGPVGVSYDTNIRYQGKLVIEGVKISKKYMRVDEKGCVYPKKHHITESMDSRPAIPLEQASPGCHFLLAAGSEDAWHCYETIPRLQKYMQHHNRSDKLECVTYPGVGHLIEPPYGAFLGQSYQRMMPVRQSSGDKADLQQTSSEDMPDGVSNKKGYVTGVPILWGGQAKPTCEAQVDLWLRMQRFFDKNVKDCSPWYQQYLTQNNDRYERTELASRDMAELSLRK